MMLSPKARQHSLLWGHSVSSDSESEEAAQKLCQQYISQKVSGVFFAPIEYSACRHETNRKIAAAIERAGIPMVLLDRCYAPYPRRSKYDLIGIDNHRAGYVATEHLLKAGAKRIVFFSRSNSAPTVEARVSGFRQALASAPRTATGSVYMGQAEDPGLVQSILKKERPDAFLCANDLTAGNLMHTLLALGKRIPDEIRMMGMDDVRYARLLPIPLTTIHQPCQNCEVVVRKSCGSK